MNHDRTEAYLRRLTFPRRHLGWTVGILLIGWAAVSLVLSERGLLDLWELESQESALRAELEDLKVKAAEVDWELAEPEKMGIERPAREKFDMQRPGEIVYHFAVAAAEENEVPEGLTSTN